MDVVLLRTLTLKSCLKFGKYFDICINSIFNAYGITGIKYLRWVYYNSSMINFNDEILYKLGITSDIRIDKPGKCESKDQFRKLENKAVINSVQIDNQTMTEKERDIQSGLHKKVTMRTKKRYLKSQLTKDRKFNSANVLTRKNQGHDMRKY